MNDQQRLVLHGMGSPNVIKVVIMLEELELPYELRYLDVIRGEQFSAAFRALNPLSKAPVLEDPELGHPLAESGAILFWLAERSGKLLPQAQSQRYEVMQWLMIQMASVGPMLGQFTHFRLLSEDSEPYAYGRYREQALKLYRLLDERLQEREWLAGGAYSIADIATFPWAEYLPRHGFDDAAFPALLAWRQKVAARPAVQAARARALKDFTPPSQDSMRAATAGDLDRFFGRTGDMPEKDYSVVTRLK